MINNTNNTDKKETLQKSKPIYPLVQDLFTENYAKMSISAKVLYSILLNRENLSKKNNWKDADGRIYFYFEQKELMEILGVSNKTIIKLFKELEQFALLERKKQGFTKADKLYLLDVARSEESTPIESEESTLTKVKKRVLSDVKKVHRNNMNYNNINKSNKNKSSSTTTPIATISPIQKPNKIDDDLSTLLKFCAKNNFRLSRINANNLLTCYSLEKILKAINRALATGNIIKNAYGYLTTVLLNLDQNKNVEVINNAGKPIGNFGNYEQRSYDFADLENKLLGLA